MSDLPGTASRTDLIVSFTRAPLLNAPGVEHQHTVGDGDRVFLIMGHEDTGEMDLVVELAQPVAKFLAHRRV